MSPGSNKEFLDMMLKAQSIEEIFFSWISSKLKSFALPMTLSRGNDKLEWEKILANHIANKM